MELAWHKEREEQTRLLQETSTLARDLRQTLFEVERERDKERLEAKRKQEQLKKTAEEEQEENRRKLNELQCDLLELRDAHAKLRTTNEKLRREKERNEKEREELRSVASFKKKSEFDDDRRVAILLEQVEILLKSIPELPPDVYTPTPPRRMKVNYFISYINLRMTGTVILNHNKYIYLFYYFSPVYVIVNFHCLFPLVEIPRIFPRGGLQPRN